TRPPSTRSTRQVVAKWQQMRVKQRGRRKTPRKSKSHPPESNRRPTDYETFQMGLWLSWAEFAWGRQSAEKVRFRRVRSFAETRRVWPRLAELAHKRHTHGGPRRAVPWDLACCREEDNALATCTVTGRD